MQIVRDSEMFPQAGPTVVTVGNFDGVHLGHQRLVAALLQRAAQKQARNVVLTFEPHPLQVLFPERHVARITPGEQRLPLLSQLGVGLTVVQTFTTEFAAMSAEVFVADVLRQRLQACHVVVGPDSRFGHDRIGGVAQLEAYGRRYGFAVETITPAQVDGIAVSSSQIRRKVQQGAVETAARMLGRCYELRGSVVQGFQRGRQLGIPTANLAPDGTLFPADGVYAGHVRLEHESHPAVINVGMNPTFDLGRRVIEAHLLDWSGPSLYGQRVSFEFRCRLRDERRFSAVTALVEQMRADVEQARQILGVR